MPVTIRILDAGEAAGAVPALAGVLADCVRRGASVGYMLPFPDEEARAWARGVAEDVAAGRTVLFVAEREGEVVGTAQLIPCTKPNQPHRADVAKVLVHSSARRQGVGSALMAALEAEARRRELLVLTLDTVTDSAGDRLYTHAGWTRVGEIPDYALFPDGRFCATTVFTKRL